MSLHRLPLDSKKLEVLIKKARHYSIFPMYFSRYMPNAQQHPISECLADLVNDAYEYISMCSEIEIEGLIDDMPRGYRISFDLFGGKLEIVTEEHRRRLALCIVASEVELSYFNFKGVIEQDLSQSEVLKIYPELKNKFDKDGLLHIDSNFILFDGGVEYKEHILHYHQLLRRGYRSNPNFDFLGRFISYYHRTKHENQFRIAIDHRRIMSKEFYTQIGEMDGWRGLPFDKNKLDDPNYIGLTVVERNKKSLFGMACDLDRTEFFWSYRDGIKTFEIEEISGDSYIFDHYYFNRYVHSERNIKTKLFRHLDGAVKVYLKDSYQNRKNSFIPKELKSHTKVKLWRIDGDIKLEIWSNLISYFFKNNEMITQYFDPEGFEKIFDLRVRDFEAWKLSQ